MMAKIKERFLKIYLQIKLMIIQNKKLRILIYGIKKKTIFNWDKDRAEIRIDCQVHVFQLIIKWKHATWDKLLENQEEIYPLLFKIHLQFVMSRME